MGSWIAESKINATDLPAVLYVDIARSDDVLVNEKERKRAFLPEGVQLAMAVR
jgi:hypothetical protein